MEINQSVLKKFNIFHPELGWERRPNEEKEDYRGGSFTIDEYGSRTCVNERGTGQFSVATYGDSFCFCNQVDDKETFQNYLAKELNVHVSNYGVGNYGLDQSLLRLKRRFDDDPADYVVMVAYPGTISRICGMWRHYSDFGKVYNLSPRYKFVDGELSFHPIPIDRKEEFLELESYSSYLERNDYHYRHWFRWHQWPHILLTTFSDRKKTSYAFWSIIHYIETLLGYPIPGLNIEECQNKAREAISPDPAKLEYTHKLYEEHQDLYCALIGEFVRFTRQNGAVPIYMPLNYEKYEEYSERNGEQIDKKVISRLKEDYPELVFCDAREQLADTVDSLSELYVQYGSGHHSPKANRRIGNILAEQIKGIKRQKEKSD